MDPVTVTFPQLKEMIADLHISWELSKAREAALAARVAELEAVITQHRCPEPPAEAPARRKRRG